MPSHETYTNTEKYINSIINITRLSSEKQFSFNIQRNSILFGIQDSLECHTLLKTFSAKKKFQSDY